MTTPGLVKSYHRIHCSYICYIWEPYKGWFILGDWVIGLISLPKTQGDEIESITQSKSWMTRLIRSPSLWVVGLIFLPSLVVMGAVLLP